MYAYVDAYIYIYIYTYVHILYYSKCIHTYVYIYIYTYKFILYTYIYIYTYMSTYIYIYIYIETERERIGIHADGHLPTCESRCPRRGRDHGFRDHGQNPQHRQGGHDRISCSAAGLFFEMVRDLRSWLFDRVWFQHTRFC